MKREPSGEPTLLTYEELLDYAERWRSGKLTDRDRRLLARGTPKTAYRQVIDGKEFLVPLPNDVCLVSASERLARSLVRPR